ncbi:LamG-like jellyroll fold domain-containing protein [Peribacillus simplex]|uniref:LamG-like jellyroll fold domain-containing protein n=1 Tax=Peribacillus simplex TaxID=1478 RepID=UPI002853647B|nr:LamG-like jellyroll fold domain-containing protein [Peribacillus simplex]MDR4926185.1 LamG-like jellyroll fold domain-containing protein [Peribacillus simplex]
MEQQYFSFNGDESIIVQRIFKSIKNSFTYELLVKPEEIHKIDIESNEGCSGIHGQKYVISPEHGRTVNEAGVGISIGINGVSVYEHTVNHLPSTLVFPTIIDDWVHVAVVYNNKTSFLYIDGELVAAGVKSAKCNVFASGVFGGHDPYGFFVGQIKYIRIWDHARTKEQIKDKISNGLSDNEQGLFGIWKFKSSSICELLSDTVLPLPKNIKTNDFF